MDYKCYINADLTMQIMAALARLKISGMWCPIENQKPENQRELKEYAEWAYKGEEHE